MSSTTTIEKFLRKGFLNLEMNTSEVIASIKGDPVFIELSKVLVTMLFAISLLLAPMIGEVKIWVAELACACNWACSWS